ncbi:leucyl aminopeptidase [Kineococcus indalonis]|uniref:leucyl aminopeptidase n=1 Tax=Kineococcus indalonis TaxID=2696566 RepID=UPI00141349BC|nr:leucyl aminopeptidase [Kineococcus indalonis]NAZ86599.1 leucyl aminopeptidase [Kineococcus indalonis]
MVRLELSSKSVKSVAADAVVLGAVRSPGTGRSAPVLLGVDDLPRATRSALSQALADLGADGAAGAVHLLPRVAGVAAPLVAVVGLGEQPADAEALRRAAGAAVRALAGRRRVALALPAGDAAAAGALAEGAALGAYAFTRYKAADRAPVEQVVLLVDKPRDKAVRAALERARALGAAVAVARDLVNTAPGDLAPADLADAAQELARGTSVQVRVLTEAELADGGYGGILGVGQGSSRPPRLVVVEHAPKGAKAHLALVGKGITFDSGGLSLKPPAGMETMKSDMSGAAAVLAAVRAVADLDLPVRVTGWLAVAENMPSGTAIRPSDVLTMHGGTTVEVLNTDAEGRLVMADALVAATAEQPDRVVDVATLTGAQVVALGNRVSAVMANDDAFRDDVLAAAERAGEQFWPMPLPEELRPSLDSQVADLANIGDRAGGMLVAGLFLREFVGRRADGSPVPWAHLDVAGPAFLTSEPHGYTHRGGTGVAVRTLVALAEDLAR